MGTYINPGFGNLVVDRREENYIDKSMMIKELNSYIGKQDPFICVTRPRRFGKTMSANMIAAYYSKGCDSHEVFEGLKITEESSFEEHINNYNVIKFDCANMSGRRRNGMSTVETIEYYILSDFREEFPDLSFPEGCDITQAIQIVYQKKHERFVIIMDEYDFLVREENNKELESYLTFLNVLFKDDTIKNAIALSYITGILPIIRDSFQSKLNNFKEFTMVNAKQLAPYMGFTREDTEYLAKKNGMDMEEFERWYDGYCLNGIELYSPKSVIEAIENRKCGNYWTQTGAYDAVSDYIDMNIDGLRDDVVLMLSGENIPVTVSTYRNTISGFTQKDEVFAYLIHLGYLAYDEETATCRIPNNEIKSEIGWVIGSCSRYKNEYEIVKLSKRLLDATIDMDEESVATALSKSHELMTSNMSYNNEQSLQSAIMFAYFYAYNSYTIIPEMPAGKGYADVVMIPYVPNKPALLIELKKDKTKGGAIEQIKEKNYPSVLDKYRGNIIIAGINYDSNTKEHSAIIERA